MADINCGDARSPKEQLKSIFCKDTDGNVAIRTTAVTDSGDDAIVCDDTRTFEQLLAAAIGVDGNGKPALRLANS